MQVSRPAWYGSTDLLRSLVVRFGVLTSLLLSLALLVLSLLERQRAVIADAEHSRGLVAAALAVDLTDQQRQALITTHARSTQEDHTDGLNFLLLVNQAGQIVYSSRPSWRQLQITDPLIDQSETDDPAFTDVVRCFRRRDDDCINLNSSNFKLHLSRFTIVRAVQKPAADLGRSRERYLAIINYDFGLLHAGLLQNLLVNLLISLAVTMALALLLWLLLARTFLARFAELAQTDALTQLMNRGLFMELAKDVLAEAEERNAELVFVILDIDHFKRINDTYGHGCGDDALRHVAEIFRAVSRRDDLICRFGGEEFAMLLTSSRESAARALERLRLQLGMNALEHGIHRLTIQASMGAVATRDCGYNLDYLYSSADQALYSAKRAGRNRVAWSEGRVLSRLAS